MNFPWLNVVALGGGLGGLLGALESGSIELAATNGILVGLNLAVCLVYVLGGRLRA